MSRSVLIRAAVAASLVVSASSHAADPLGEVVVSATRSAESVDETLAAVTVITREDIERAQVVSVPELLNRYVPSVDFSTGGGEGKVSSLFLRGTESDHVLLIIDGVRMGSVTLGTAPWQHLSASMIDKIEVVRGPRSSLYGADAIGGIISITTRKGSVGQTHGSIGGGSFATKKASAGTTLGNENTQFSINAAYLDTDGFDAKVSNNPDDDGYTRKSLDLSLRHAFNDKVDIALSALRATGETDYDGFGDNGDSFANPGGAPTRYYSKFTEQNLSLSFNAQINDLWTTQVILGESRDDSEAFDSFPGYYNTTRSQFSWQNDVGFANGSLLTLGADYLNDEVDSHQAYAETSRDNVGLFAEYQLQIGAHDVQFSLRQDDNEAFGTHTTGGVSVGHPLGSKARLIASYGTAFKAPTFNELYYPNYGNPDLKPEESDTLELAVTADIGGGRLAARLFRTDLDNLISAVLVDPANFTYQAQNIDKARIDGLELEWQQTMMEWDVRTSFTLLDPVDRETDKTLASRVKQTFKFNADRSFGNYSVGGTLIAQGKRAAGTYSSALAGYETLDLRFGYRFNQHLQLKAQVNNVLDRQYQTRDGYNTADRNVMVSLSYQ